MVSMYIEASRMGMDEDIVGMWKVVERSEGGLGITVGRRERSIKSV